jgi:hypothetical protein
MELKSFLRKKRGASFVWLEVTVGARGWFRGSRSTKCLALEADVNNLKFLYTVLVLSISVPPSCIMITLVSSDDVLFEVDREIAERSSVIRQMLEGFYNRLSLQ